MAIDLKIDREVKALRAELDQKRRVALLLETLAHKEDIRLQRFSEIRVLIDELRYVLLSSIDVGQRDLAI